MSAAELHDSLSGHHGPQRESCDDIADGARFLITATLGGVTGQFAARFIDFRTSIHAQSDTEQECEDNAA